MFYRSLLLSEGQRPLLPRCRRNFFGILSVPLTCCHCKTHCWTRFWIQVFPIEFAREATQAAAYCTWIGKVVVCVAWSCFPHGCATSETLCFGCFLLQINGYVLSSCCLICSAKVCAAPAPQRLLCWPCWLGACLRSLPPQIRRHYASCFGELQLAIGTASGT